MKIRLGELKQIIKEEMETAKLVTTLNRVDWDYQMSDDPRAFQRGKEEVQTVTSLLSDMDKESADVLLADPALRPYAKVKVMAILGRK